MIRCLWTSSFEKRACPLNSFCFDGRDRLFVYGSTDETFAPIRYDHCSLVGCYLPLSASRGR